jgi:ureidoglycolate hydrolase
MASSFRGHFLFLAMKNTTIYLDESGDLGWLLDKPHNQGGSSRYLTLAAVIVSAHKTHHIARVVRNLYKARNRPKSNELKSVELRPHERAIQKTSQWFV